MTLIELLFFFLPVFLGVFLWRFVFRTMGSWGALPAFIVGFGVWAVAWVLLQRRFRKKPTGRSDDATAGRICQGRARCYDQSG